MLETQPFFYNPEMPPGEYPVVHDELPPKILELQSPLPHTEVIANSGLAIIALRRAAQGD